MSGPGQCRYSNNPVLDPKQIKEIILNCFEFSATFQRKMHFKNWNSTTYIQPFKFKKNYEKTLNLKSKLIHFVYIDGKETRLIGIRHKKSPSLNRNRHLLPI